jgi:hypothetical protein
MGNWTSADIARIQARRDAARADPSGKASADAVASGGEASLHTQILEECGRRGWLAFHGSMIHRTHRMEGEPDFIIAVDGGQVLFIEAKTRMSKLTMEQLGIHAWLNRLGQRVAVVRSLREFIEVSQRLLTV